MCNLWHTYRFFLNNSPLSLTNRGDNNQITPSLFSMISPLR